MSGKGRWPGTPAERFYAKVDRNGPLPADPSLGPCWVWTGQRFGSGYGYAWHGGRKVNAHRLAYAIEHGSVPADVVLRHRCDRKLCVRPSHLEPGTQLQNVHDMLDRGRGRTGRLSGDANPAATHTLAQVREMRARYAAGETGRSLGDEYGFPGSSVYAVLRGEIWKEPAP